LPRVLARKMRLVAKTLNYLFYNKMLYTANASNFHAVGRICTAGSAAPQIGRCCRTAKLATVTTSP
jgi:hypothetical protein